MRYCFLPILRSCLPSPFALVLAAMAVCPSSAVAQVGGEWEVRFDYPSSLLLGETGRAVAGLGDVDLDGYSDYCISTPYALSYGGNYGEGRVNVYSGASGGTLYTYRGGDGFGSFVAAAGDTNADGHADFLINEWNGTTSLFSGSSGAFIRGFPGGVSGGLGDLDGDWYDDVGVADAYGNVRAYSGSTGAEIWHHPSWWAIDIAALHGDVDADGLPDLVIGGTGKVLAVSGKTGLLLWQISGWQVGGSSAFGRSVSGSGDLDRDGLPDVLVGDPNTAAGSVHCLSGKDGSLIHRVDGRHPGDTLGVSVASVGDLDSDGIDDFLAGAPQASSGHKTGQVLLFSGATGDLLNATRGYAYSEFGASVDGAGDTDGDGLQELVIGAPKWDNWHGTAVLLALDPFLHLSAKALSASNGQPVQLDLDFPTSEAGQSYAVLASGGIGPMKLAGLEIPLSEGNKLTALMLQGWAPSNVLDWHGVLDANGDARCTILSDPRLARHLGSTIAIAAVSYDPASATGRLSSIARHLRIVP